MIYIYGGAFVGGSPAVFGADFLIEREIVVVNFNHRHNIFGFMSLGTSEYSGNMAMKDQQLALKWTYENIDFFGGDKHQITLAGHSSGLI